MLTLLTNYPHPHIVVHHASWSQGGESYILYPMAGYDLRQFTKKVEPPKLNSEEVIWFFEQLTGLAEAISHVHDVEVEPTKANPQPTKAAKGCHHDIKPENILVFDPVYRPFFKITDFGAGGFNKVQNGKVVSIGFTKTGGTETYFAPDLQKDKVVGAPFDIWALGCVYLELLLWLFRFYADDQGDGFSTKRASFTGADPNYAEDKFWYQNGSKFGLKRIVHSLIEDLEGICRGMRAFERLIRIIRRHLLRIRSKKRWKAEMLVASLVRISKQAKSDLRRNPNFYLDKYKQFLDGSQRSLDLQTERVDPFVSTPGSTRSRSPSASSQKGAESDGSHGSMAGSPDSQVLVGAGAAPVLTRTTTVEENSQEVGESVEELVNENLLSPRTTHSLPHSPTRKVSRRTDT